uniref:GCN5-like N-acetyltransferase n=1 Tax=Lithothamnion corallioides TaxID=1277934 RepID=UPI0023EFF8C3|nr:GCN5-like N-acetyltransferase [Lithothamnion corallioides]WEA77129.1 GCN5-like N-acetyltransferase [Lithothamnion corallioides]
MTFWKLFWNKTKILQINQHSNKYNYRQNKILIKDFDYKDKKINIFLSKDKNIDLYELEELCDTVGWVRRPLKKVKIAIEHSFLTISLSYQKNNKKKLIAFARATSDNTFNATIWDVVVHPEFQGRGLGKILINEAIKQLRYADINTITLFADPQVISFYKNLGFISDPDGVKGMFWYPH